MPKTLDPTLGRQPSDIIRARYLNTVLLEADLATYNIQGERKGELVYCEDSAEIKCWNGTSWIDVDVSAHLADTADAHDASAISFTPNGSIAATDVQAAIQEVRDEAGSTHTLLDGSSHSDTAVDTVSRGSLIVGINGPLWDELPIGSSGTFLRSDGTDPSYQTGYAYKTYVFHPSVAIDEDIVAGDRQDWHHSGPLDETVISIISDFITAPGTNIIFELEFASSNTFDGSPTWTEIDSITHASGDGITLETTTNFTNSTITANRIIRFNVASTSGTAPRNGKITLRTRSLIPIA